MMLSHFSHDLTLILYSATVLFIKYFATFRVLDTSKISLRINQQVLILNSHRRSDIGYE